MWRAPSKDRGQLERLALVNRLRTEFVPRDVLRFKGIRIYQLDPPGTCLDQQACDTASQGAYAKDDYPLSAQYLGA